MATVSRSSETVCDANLWFGCVKRRPKTAAERSPGRAPVRSPPRSPPSNRSAPRGATAFPSMVAVRADLAADPPIGPAGIGQDHRQDDDAPDEPDDLALRWFRRQPALHGELADHGLAAHPHNHPDQAKKPPT